MDKHIIIKTPSETGNWRILKTAIVFWQRRGEGEGSFRIRMTTTQGSASYHIRITHLSRDLFFRLSVGVREVLQAEYDNGEDKVQFKLKLNGGFLMKTLQEKANKYIVMHTC